MKEMYSAHVEDTTVATIEDLQMGIITMISESKCYTNTRRCSHSS